MGLVPESKSGAAPYEAALSTARRSALDVDVYASCVTLVEEPLPVPQAVDVLRQTITALNAGAPVSAALDTIAPLLLIPTCTLSVAAQFRPLLLDILVRSLKQAHSAGDVAGETTLRILHAFALLIDVFPEIHE